MKAMHARDLALMTALLAATGGACNGASEGLPPGSDAGADAATPACTVQPVTSCPTPPPHYADIAGIMAARCSEPCHTGLVADGPWPLLSYEDVADWADVIRDQVVTCAMPPADGGVTMTDDEARTLLAWIRCGHLE